MTTVVDYSARGPRGLAFINQWMSDIIDVIVALRWLIPDRRIESRIHVERD